mmetsp:Transcript_27026/g.62437  ORF Transcript_27026/g.62437 Transcript_27026/m.62437 type:complete len:130 (-) Transcript_27026:52-441(-)
MNLALVRCAFSRIDISMVMGHLASKGPYVTIVTCHTNWLVGGKGCLHQRGTFESGKLGPVKGRQRWFVRLSKTLTTGALDGNCEQLHKRAVDSMRSAWPLFVSPTHHLYPKSVPMCNRCSDMRPRATAT